MRVAVTRAWLGSALPLRWSLPMSSFALYLVGMLILIGGLAYGAFLAGLAPQWIAVGVVVLLGLGIVKAVARTRRPDPPAA